MKNGYEISHVTFDRFSAVLLYNFLIQSLGSILSIVISITVALLLHCLIFSLCSYPFFCIVFSELSPSFFYLLFIVIIIFPVIFFKDLYLISRFLLMILLYFRLLTEREPLREHLTNIYYYKYKTGQFNRRFNLIQNELNKFQRIYFPSKPIREYTHLFILNLHIYRRILPFSWLTNCHYQ